MKRSPGTQTELHRETDQAIKSLDHLLLADIFEKLIAEEPEKWISRLLISGAIPQPSPNISPNDETQKKQVHCVLKAACLLGQRKPTEYSSILGLMSIMLGLVRLQSIYSSIKTKLSELDFFELPAEVQILRLVAFLESQHRNAESKFTELQSDETPVSLINGHIASVQLEFGQTKVSIPQALEGTCENIELILRMILHSRKLPTAPDFETATTPYGDPEIRGLLAMAGLWRLADNQWANIKYRNWSWDTDPPRFSPKDEQEFVRECAGNLRYQNWVQESILHRLLDQQSSREYDKALRNAASKINYPDACTLWNGHFCAESLQGVIKRSCFSLVVEEYVNKRHYEPMLNAAKVGPLGWRQWIEGKNVLFSFAEVVIAAAVVQIQESSDDDQCIRRAMLCTEQSLVKMVVACTNFSEEDAVNFIESQKFDPKNKKLEIWDQPLIPCADGIVAFSPSLLKTGSPARALENFVGQWSDGLFDRRGVPFEKCLSQQLNAQKDVRSVQGLKVHISHESELEFDIIAAWKGYVLLVEAKCLKAIFSPADYNHAKRHVEKSIDQLVLRRDSLESVWDKIRAKASDLDLPEVFIGNDKIICVSVTNAMEFTGYVRDGVVVSDESSFIRFFGDQFVVAIPRNMGDGSFGDSSSVIPIEPIRPTETPQPEHLVAYLKNPIQMRRLTDSMSIVFHEAIGIESTDQTYFYADVDFHPDVAGAAIPYEPLFVDSGAYATAQRLFSCGMNVSDNELREDETLAQKIKTLIAGKVLRVNKEGKPPLLSLLADPLLLQTPDGRYAIGENACGQTSWWFSRTFPDESLPLKPV